MSVRINVNILVSFDKHGCVAVYTVQISKVDVKPNLVVIIVVRQEVNMLRLELRKE